MNPRAFHEKLRINPHPVVVDPWAPWCGPCKAIKPILESLAQEYSGRVDLWQINADDSQELLRDLKVYAIPTLIVYQHGQETLCQVGAKPAGELKSMFETLAMREPTGPRRAFEHGSIHTPGRCSGCGRDWLRNPFGPILLGRGGLLMFSGIYDRCPIWRALTGRFNKLTGRA